MLANLEQPDADVEEAVPQPTRSSLTWRTPMLPAVVSAATQMVPAFNAEYAQNVQVALTDPVTGAVTGYGGAGWNHTAFLDPALQGVGGQVDRVEPQPTL
jgi:hypothetical protein